MFVWSKLSAAKWMDAWEERFPGNPNLVIEMVKGGRSIRIRLFCNTQKEANAIVSQFGGSVRKMADAEWNKPVEAPRPVMTEAVAQQPSIAQPQAALATVASYKELIALAGARQRRKPQPVRAALHRHINIRHLHPSTLPRCRKQQMRRFKCAKRQRDIRLQRRPSRSAAICMQSAR